MHSRRPTRRLPALVALPAATALLAGCAGLQQPEVERVATDFASGDPATRCALLAPATLAALTVSEPAACGTTVGELAPSGGQVVQTEVGRRGSGPADR